MGEEKQKMFTKGVENSDSNNENDHYNPLKEKE